VVPRRPELPVWCDVSIDFTDAVIMPTRCTRHDSALVVPGSLMVVPGIVVEAVFPGESLHRRHHHPATDPTTPVASASPVALSYGDSKQSLRSAIPRTTFSAGSQGGLVAS